MPEASPGLPQHIHTLELLHAFSSHCRDASTDTMPSSRSILTRIRAYDKIPRKECWMYRQHSNYVFNSLSWKRFHGCAPQPRSKNINSTKEANVNTLRHVSRCTMGFQPSKARICDEYRPETVTPHTCGNSRNHLSATKQHRYKQIYNTLECNT